MTYIFAIVLWLVMDLVFRDEQLLLLLLLLKIETENILNELWYTFFCKNIRCTIMMCSRDWS